MAVAAAAAVAVAVAAAAAVPVPVPWQRPAVAPVVPRPMGSSHITNGKLPVDRFGLKRSRLDQNQLVHGRMFERPGGDPPTCCGLAGETA